MLMLFLIFEKYDNKRPDPICAMHPTRIHISDQMTLEEFRLKMVSN